MFHESLFSMTVYEIHYFLKRRLAGGNEVLQSVAVVHTLIRVKERESRKFIFQLVASLLSER